MTFSNRAKKEAAQSLKTENQKRICLYGILLYAKIFTDNLIQIQTESKVFADTFTSLMNDVFGEEIIYTKTDGNGRGKNFSAFEITGEYVNKICLDFDIFPNQRKISSKIIASDESSFLCGVFISSGSITDPGKEYHLEFTCPTEKLCNDLRQVIGIKSGIHKRKRSWVLYIENKDNIEDFLTFIRAGQCTIELINTEIFKNVRNRANRMTNCDIANIRKVSDTAVRQTTDIKYIFRNDSSLLPEDLREIAELRLNNPDASLEELGSMLRKPIGKSGVSRRFRRIAVIAQKIREERDKT